VNASADVCVVGAGVMGLFTALELAEDGADVLVVDRGVPGAQASSANAGTLAVQNKRNEALPLVLASLVLWEEMSDRLGIDVEYERRGGVRVAHSDEDVTKLRASVREQTALGARVEWLDRDGVARAAPYLAKTIQAASYCPDDGMANPFAVTRGALRACRRAGCRIWPGWPIVDLRQVDDDRVECVSPRGTITAAHVLIAAGAWTERLTARAGRTLALSHDVLQAVITDSGPMLFPHVVTHVRGNLTLKQQRTGRVLIGGAWKGRGDLETGTSRVVHEQLLGNLRWALQTVPALATTRVLRAWTGFEGRTPDRLPLLGPLPGTPRIHALGCAGGGFTLSPFAGRLAADLIAHRTPALPVDRYLIGRRFTDHPSAPSESTGGLDVADLAKRGPS
jgi:sarcosine oxidase, subunit beta